jgi:hypothetical protein
VKLRLPNTNSDINSDGVTEEAAYMHPKGARRSDEQHEEDKRDENHV